MIAVSNNIAKHRFSLYNIKARKDSYLIPSAAEMAKVRTRRYRVSFKKDNSSIFYWSDECMGNNS